MFLHFDTVKQFNTSLVVVIAAIIALSGVVLAQSSANQPPPSLNNNATVEDLSRADLISPVYLKAGHNGTPKSGQEWCEEDGAVCVIGYHSPNMTRQSCHDTSGLKQVQEAGEEYQFVCARKKALVIINDDNDSTNGTSSCASVPGVNQLCIAGVSLHDSWSVSCKQTVSDQDWWQQYAYLCAAPTYLKQAADLQSAKDGHAVCQTEGVSKRQSKKKSVCVGGVNTKGEEVVCNQAGAKYYCAYEK